MRDPEERATVGGSYVFEPTGELRVVASFGSSYEILVPAANRTDAAICRAMPGLLRELWRERMREKRALRARAKAEQLKRRRETELARNERWHAVLITGAVAWRWHQRLTAFVNAVEGDSSTTTKRQSTRAWVTWAKHYLADRDPLTGCSRPTWQAHAVSWVNAIENNASICALDGYTPSDEDRI